MTAMSLGLAHSLSRYKLKFSPDKIDTMIVQAVSLLDDLDKELNNYIMRTREWCVSITLIFCFVQQASLTTNVNNHSTNFFPKF